MSDSPSGEAPISDRQLLEDRDALQRQARPLYAVPDDAEGPAGPNERWTYEPPDVVGGQRKREEYRQAMPELSEADLNSYVEIYESHSAAATRSAYEAALKPFYRVAERGGFDPLRCEPALLEGYVLHLMTYGKVGPSGDRDRSNPYSLTFFKTFLAAHRCATQVQGLPEIAGLVDVDRLLRGYNHKRGSELPRCAKKALLSRDLVDIERTVREGTTLQAATLRAAVTLGCDPHLNLGVPQLCRLTFADIAFSDDRAVLATMSRGCPKSVILAARAGDSACPVAALKSLREAKYLRMRAELRSHPTDAQIDAQGLFVNARYGPAFDAPGTQSCRQAGLRRSRQHGPHRWRAAVADA